MLLALHSRKASTEGSEGVSDLPHLPADVKGPGGSP